MFESEEFGCKEKCVEESEEQRDRRNDLALGAQDFGMHGKERKEGILGQFGRGGKLQPLLSHGKTRR